MKKLLLIAAFFILPVQSFAANSISIVASGIAVFATWDLLPVTGGIIKTQTTRLICPKKDSTLGALSNVVGRVNTIVITPITGATLTHAMKKNNKVISSIIPSTISLSGKYDIEHTVSRADTTVGTVTVREQLWCSRLLDGQSLQMQLYAPGVTFDATKGHVIRYGL